MRKVKAITIKNGEPVFNLASTTANDDWIRSARLLKEGKGQRQRNFNSRKTVERWQEVKGN